MPIFHSAHSKTCLLVDDLDSPYADAMKNIGSDSLNCVVEQPLDVVLNGALAKTVFRFLSVTAHWIFLSVFLLVATSFPLLEAKLIPFFKSDFALFFPHAVFVEPETVREDTESPFLNILKLDGDGSFDTTLEELATIGQINLDGGIFWRGNDTLFQHTILVKIKFVFDQEMVPGYTRCIFCSYYKRYKVPTKEKDAVIVNENTARVDKDILSTRLGKLQLSTKIDLRYAYMVNAGLVLWSSLHFVSLLPTDVLRIDPLNNLMKTERFATSFSVSLLPTQLGITAKNLQTKKTDENQVSSLPDGFELVFGILYGYWLRENYAFNAISPQVEISGEIEGRQASLVLDGDFNTKGNFHELMPTLQLIHRFEKDNYAFLNGIDFSHRLELYPKSPVFEESNGQLNFKTADVAVNYSNLVVSSSINHRAKKTRSRPNPMEITFTAAYKLAVDYKSADFWVSGIPLSDHTIRSPIHESNYTVVTNSSSDSDKSYNRGAPQTELRHSFWFELSLFFDQKIDWRNQISIATQTFPMNRGATPNKEADGNERLVGVRSGVNIVVEDLANIEPFIVYINHYLKSGSARRHRHVVSLGLQYSTSF